MKSLRVRLNESLVNESVQNLLAGDLDKKTAMVDQVWQLLKDAYASQGGIKGSGFASKQDMLRIPFWKLDIVDGKVLAVILYKFKQESPNGVTFRKMAAGGILRDPETKAMAKKKFSNMIKDDFKRSIMEVSGGMLDFLRKGFPQEFKQYRLTVKEAQAILTSRELTAHDVYTYSRILGGAGKEVHKKMMFGTIQPKR